MNTTFGPYYQQDNKEKRKNIWFIIWGVLSDIVIIILAILLGLKCDKYSSLHKDYNSLEKSYNRL